MSDKEIKLCYEALNRRLARILFEAWRQHFMPKKAEGEGFSLADLAKIKEEQEQHECG
jgi:hypothetical protein